MGIFETFDIKCYEINATDKAQYRFSKSFIYVICIVCPILFLETLIVFIGCIVHNDMTEKCIDYKVQIVEYPFVNQSADEDLVLSCADYSDRVNINYAQTDDLMSLPEIGKGRASAIIEYRNENGRFRTAEEIMNIKSIKEKVYYTIKDNITVE